MNSSIEELREVLRACITNAEAAGMRVHPGGTYAKCDANCEVCRTSGLCLLGSVLFSRGITNRSELIGAPHEPVAVMLNMEVDAVKRLEKGFEGWPSSVEDAYHQLGRELRPQR